MGVKRKRSCLSGEIPRFSFCKRDSRKTVKVPDPLRKSYPQSPTHPMMLGSEYRNRIQKERGAIQPSFSKSPGHQDAQLPRFTFSWNRPS